MIWVESVAVLQPQPLDRPLGDIVLHEQPPHEAAAYVLDRQQQWPYINTQVIVVPVRRLETEGIDKAIAAFGWVTPGQRVARGRFQGDVFTDCRDAFGWREHDGRPGRIWRHNSVVPDVLIAH